MSLRPQESSIRVNELPLDGQNDQLIRQINDSLRELQRGLNRVLEPQLYGFNGTDGYTQLTINGQQLTFYKGVLVQVGNPLEQVTFPNRDSLFGTLMGTLRVKFTDSYQATDPTNFPKITLAAGEYFIRFVAGGFIYVYDESSDYGIAPMSQTFSLTPQSPLFFATNDSTVAALSMVETAAVDNVAHTATVGSLTLNGRLCNFHGGYLTAMGYNPDNPPTTPPSTLVEETYMNAFVYRFALDRPRDFYILVKQDDVNPSEYYNNEYATFQIWRKENVTTTIPTIPAPQIVTC